MRLIADTHTHTIACDHAYSTVEDNAKAAAQRSLLFLAMTEHAPALPGAPGDLHFRNLHMIPPVLHDVVILMGAEANILDSKGALDLPPRTMQMLDWVIASMHIPTFSPKTPAEHTSAYLAVAENPDVDVIGHCGDGRFAFDYETVIKACARHGKIVEINAHSFGCRPGSKENCPKIAALCAKHGVRITVSSDAHHASGVGEFTAAVAMLEGMEFPQELIVNADRDRFLQTVGERCTKKTAKALQNLPWRG